jgi:sphinganine-1-phosphate aldolase
MELSDRARAILDEARRAGANDVAWRQGRVFSLAYYAGPEVELVAEGAYAMYSSANGLNADAFPSLKKFQSEVVATVTNWVAGDAEAAGFMTSGGTESILMAVKASRERGRRERGITAPNAILPSRRPVTTSASRRGGFPFGVIGVPTWMR